MTNVLDMDFIRYLNLFEKISRVRTNHCFRYNNNIVFAVPKNVFSKAIGKDGRNIRKISEILGKRIKIVRIAEDERDAERFFSDVVDPFTFKSFKIEEGEFVVSASRQNKAGLIGRNKTRLKEMQEISEQFFNRKLRLV